MRTSRRARRSARPGRTGPPRTGPPPAGPAPAPAPRPAPPPRPPPAAAGPGPGPGFESLAVGPGMMIAARVRSQRRCTVSSRVERRRTGQAAEPGPARPGPSPGRPPFPPRWTGTPRRPTAHPAPREVGSGQKDGISPFDLVKRRPANRFGHWTGPGAASAAVENAPFGGPRCRISGRGPGRAPAGRTETFDHLDHARI
jgi:translation initiation factor IF-2